jgi:SAM-dependent methyltransferase
MPASTMTGQANLAPTPGRYRLYTDLAEWWPLISPPGEYAQEAAYLAGVLGQAGTPTPVREVLDLGSGGGHMAAQLKVRFTVTLVDISEPMLAVSQRLNPECRHVHGDMRRVRLGRPFDAVLVHDAVDYVTSRADLTRVIGTAFAHCRPAGLALFVPDHVKDTFRPVNGAGGGRAPDGRQASFRERTWDPDPGDDVVRAEYEFTLRSADGTVEVVREDHELGAFSRDTWSRLLAEAGFVTAAIPADADLPGRKPAHLFAVSRPA